MYLLNKLNAGSQVHAEVNELPDNPLLLVLLLLQDKHVVVEELLQLLISEVDAQLLKRVELQWENTVEQLESVLTPITYYYTHQHGSTHTKDLTLTTFYQTHREHGSTHIKDLKPSDVQHTDEVLARMLGVQSLIDPHDHPVEHLLVH